MAPPVLPPTVPPPELLPEQALIAIVSTASPEIEAIRRNVTVPPGKELPATRAHVRYPCKVGSANPQCQARHARSRPNREQGPAPATRPDKSTDREQVWFGRSPPLQSTSCLRSGLCLALGCTRPRLAEAAPLTARNADTFTASGCDSRWIRNSRCSTGHGGHPGRSRGGTPPRIPAIGTPGRARLDRRNSDLVAFPPLGGTSRRRRSRPLQESAGSTTPKPLSARRSRTNPGRARSATRFSHKDSSAESVAV